MVYSIIYLYVTLVLSSYCFCFYQVLGQYRWPELQESDFSYGGQFVLSLIYLQKAW